jgi:hypothetical protein
VLIEASSRSTVSLNDLRGKLVHEHEVSFPARPVFTGGTCLLTCCCPESAAHNSTHNFTAVIVIHEQGSALSLNATARAREGFGSGRRLPSSLRQDAQCGRLVLAGWTGRRFSNLLTPLAALCRCLSGHQMRARLGRPCFPRSLTTLGLCRVGERNGLGSFKSKQILLGFPKTALNFCVEWYLRYTCNM